MSSPTSAPSSAGRPTRVLRRVLLLAVVFVGLPALVLEYAGLTPLRRYALGVVFVLWAAFFFGLMRSRRQEGRGGALPFNVAVLLLALAVLEVVLGTGLRRSARIARRPPVSSYVREDALLGYAPVPLSVSRFTNVIGDQILYDVTYTIDEDGCRVQPSVPSGPRTRGVLCFGGSFTYGTGLADEQTWPWRLQELLGDDWRVRNLAYMAYGPHQMLAALEGGRVANVATEAPARAIYLAIPDHARRVAGNAGYGRAEPRYVLQPDGAVVRRGLYGDEPAHVWSRRLRQLAGHSNLVRALQQRDRPGQYDVPLMVAIVAAARDRLRATWPDCAFDVVLWDGLHPMGRRVREGLEAAGLRVWPVEDLIPGYAVAPEGFRLHAQDPHPNARAADALARALAARLRDPR